jgi:glycosyltransferase involved in cell wall biosynthesis
MEISVVIPLFNSGFIIDALIEALVDWNEKTTFHVHFIFVDDGSKDNTLPKLASNKLAEKISYEIIRLANNEGQHTATWVGIQNAKSSIIVTIDDDLQHSPLFIDSMINDLVKNDADLVYASFRDKKHNLVRNFGTVLLQKILFLMTKIDYRNVTSFRVIKKEMLDLYRTDGIRKVYFLEELLIKASNKTISSKIDHDVSVRKKSNYSFFKLSKMAISILFFHSTFLLKFITKVGLLLSIVCFLLGLYFLYQKLFHYVEIGFTGIIVSLLFSTGILLFSLGIIGEFLRRILVRQQSLDVVRYKKEK